MHGPKCGSHNLARTHSHGLEKIPRALFFLAAFILLAVFLAPLHASTWRGIALLRQIELAPWRIGPFRLQPQIVLSDFGYDSNIYYTPNAPSDYTLTAGPALTSYVSLKKKIIFALYESPRYVYYFQTARERSWNNYFRGDVHFLLNKFFITLGYTNSDARERWNYEIDIRPRRKENGYNGNILWQPSRKTSFSVGFRTVQYNYQVSEPSAFNIPENLNRRENFVNASFFYQLTGRTQAFAEVEYGYFDFQYPTNPRDSRSWAYYGGFNFSTTGKIRGTVRLGYKIFDSIARTAPDFKGLVGNANVSFDIFRSVTLRGSYRRDVQFSSWISNFYNENTSGAGLSYYFLRRRFRLDYDYSQTVASYPHQASAGAAIINREDSFWSNSVALFYRIGKKMGLGIRYGRMTRSIPVYNWSTTRDFAGFNITYDF